MSCVSHSSLNKFLCCETFGSYSRCTKPFGPVPASRVVTFPILPLSGSKLTTPQTSNAPLLTIVTKVDCITVAAVFTLHVEALELDEPKGHFANIVGDLIQPLCPCMVTPLRNCESCICYDPTQLALYRRAERLLESVHHGSRNFRCRHAHSRCC